MEEQLISSETAKLSKEKGFNEPVDNYFQKTCAKELSELHTPFKNKWNTHDVVYSRPTQSLLQKWLRDKHKIYVFIQKTYGFKWYIDNTEKCDGAYNNYEEALEEGLQAALKSIK